MEDGEIGSGQVTKRKGCRWSRRGRRVAFFKSWSRYGKGSEVPSNAAGRASYDWEWIGWKFYSYSFHCYHHLPFSFGPYAPFSSAKNVNFS